MRRPILLALALAALAGCGAPSGSNVWGARYEVYGVDEGDMLKLRGGPGTGFDVLAGLPNGTVVKVYECTQTGGTRWCEVTLDRDGGMKGYASFAYLREL